MNLDYFYHVIVYLSLMKVKSYHWFQTFYEGKNTQVKRLRENEETVISHFQNLAKDPTHIIDNIYLGNSFNSSNILTLKKFGIEKIVNVTQEIPNSFEQEIEYLRIPVRDTRDNFIETYLETSCNFIVKNKKHQVLVHCYMGSSRSAAVVVYYLIKHKKMDLDEAIKYVNDKRDLVNINENFVNEMRNMIKIGKI